MTKSHFIFKIKVTFSSVLLALYVIEKETRVGSTDKISSLKKSILLFPWVHKRWIGFCHEVLHWAFVVGTLRLLTTLSTWIWWPFKYCTRAIITRSWLLPALDYKPQILVPKIEEFPSLVHKFLYYKLWISGLTHISQICPKDNIGLKEFGK